MNIGDWVVIERGGDADVGHVNGITGELCEIAVMDIHMLKESDPKEILQVPCEAFSRLGAMHWYASLNGMLPESPEGFPYCPVGEPHTSHGGTHR